LNKIIILVLFIKNYLKIFKIYNLAIKCIEFIYISDNEGFKFYIIFIDVLKYRKQIGFGTLVVYTVKNEYFN
jgi:hypothetical protein